MGAQERTDMDRNAGKISVKGDQDVTTVLNAWGWLTASEAVPVPKGELGFEEIDRWARALREHSRNPWLTTQNGDMYLFWNGTDGEDPSSACICLHFDAEGTTLGADLEWDLQGGELGEDNDRFFELLQPVVPAVAG
jgi:hypothetical protein